MRISAILGSVAIALSLGVASLSNPAFAQAAAAPAAAAPAATAAPAAAAAPSAAEDVTSARLLNSKSETGNWLSVHGSYDSHRYSQLNQITKDNVTGLHLAYSTPLNPSSAGGRYTSAQNEGTPLAENGFLYIESGWSVITKVDVRDGTRGKIVWRYDPQIDKAYVSDTACCGAENRGIGMWHDQIIALTLDGRMVSLNKDTGKVTWEKQMADKARAETFTVAPQIIKDTAIFGPAGGEYGIRGWLEAVNLTDGSIKWRTYTVPATGEPGNETWEGNDWQTGGGPIWETGSYDPDLNLVYWGTGNPAPQFDAEYRAGDNLYTDSLLALDADTGKMKWYFQYTPNDPYDHDEIGDNQLIDMTIDGAPRKLIVHAARNGFVYAFDRTNGQFLSGQQYVQFLTWTNGLDPKTGKPTSYNPDSKLQTYAAGSVARRGGPASLMCPGLTGGKNWQPASFSESSNLLYVAASEGCNNTYTAEAAPEPTVTGGTWKLTDPKGWRGRGFAPAAKRPAMPDGAAALHFSLNAIDPATGKVVAKQMMDDEEQGLLSTAGGLVFGGDHAGNLTAYDPKTLAVLWQRNVGTALYGPPMTFSVDGKQYVAILAGGPASTTSKDPSVAFFVPQDALYVFAL
jgi:alcohol dehydrogenase (cytochrome c)